MENRGKLSTREKDEQDAKLGQLHKLWEQTHLCRNQQQALAFGAQLALPEMATELGEQAYSKWAAKEYFSEQWLHWHTTATGSPGCLPSNQPIESNHQVIQQSKMTVLRAGIEYLLETGFPKLLFWSHWTFAALWCAS